MTAYVDMNPPLEALRLSDGRRIIVQRWEACVLPGGQVTVKIEGTLVVVVADADPQEVRL